MPAYTTTGKHTGSCYNDACLHNAKHAIISCACSTLCDILPILTDPSLDLSNFTLALDSLPDSEWDEFGNWMNVPWAIRRKIRSQFHSDGERKTALFRVYLTEHPHPTWEHVSDALYRLREGKYHSVLERLQSMFPTGESVHRTFHMRYHTVVITLYIEIVMVYPH